MLFVLLTVPHRQRTIHQTELHLVRLRDCHIATLSIHHYKTQTVVAFFQSDAATPKTVACQFVQPDVQQ